MPSKSSAEVPRTYAIQLGYFSTSSYAESLVAKAKAKGLEGSRLREEHNNSKTYYRILAGEFTSLSAAQTFLNKVHSLGVKGAIYRL
jgi:cell division protein FtsN